MLAATAASHACHVVESCSPAALFFSTQIFSAEGLTDVSDFNNNFQIFSSWEIKACHLWCCQK